MRQYVIGVDGGNTKTDYVLFSLDGVLIDYLRDGTCSHEALGYKAAETILHARIHQLLVRNRITMQDMAAGVFGLAGIDTAIQQRHFEDFFKRIGFTVCAVENDSLLGIMAGTSKGCGICSINGTGTVTGGMDAYGGRLQVGGLGFMVGDDASGTYIAYAGARAVYDSLFRCGDPTAMTKPVFHLLGIEQGSQMLQAISDYGDVLGSSEMTDIVFAAAADNDGPALAVLDYAGKQLAKTSAGCVLNLRFDQAVEAVLAGAVWVKAGESVLYSLYKHYMAQWLIDYEVSYHILKEPPVAGAVLWALKLAGYDCFQYEIRQRVFAETLKGMSAGQDKRMNP